MAKSLKLDKDMKAKIDLSDKYAKEIAKTKDFTTDKTTPEEVAEKLAKTKTKKQMTAKQLENLRQFSKAPRSQESKINSVKQLRYNNSDEDKMEIKKDQDEENEELLDFDGDSIQEKEDIILPKKVDSQRLKDSLNVTELKFFIEKWNEYMLEHGKDFNEAEDVDDLTELIMNMIFQWRLNKLLKSKPSSAFMKAYVDREQNIHTRIQTLKTNLNIRRKDKVEGNERKTSEFMKLIIEVAKKEGGLRGAMENKITQDTNEIKEMLLKKKEREGLITFE